MMDRPAAFPNGSSIPMRKTSCTDGHNSCAYARVSVSGYEINNLPERFEDRALVISTKKGIPICITTHESQDKYICFIHDLGISKVNHHGSNL